MFQWRKWKAKRKSLGNYFSIFRFSNRPFSTISVPIGSHKSATGHFSTTFAQCYHFHFPFSISIFHFSFSFSFSIHQFQSSSDFFFAAATKLGIPDCAFGVDIFYHFADTVGEKRRIQLRGQWEAKDPGSLQPKEPGSLQPIGRQTFESG